jgi:hypothetical protein
MAGLRKGPSNSSQFWKAALSAGQWRAFFARRQRTLDAASALPYRRSEGRRAAGLLYVQILLVFDRPARYEAVCDCKYRNGDRPHYQGQS